MLDASTGNMIKNVVVVCVVFNGFSNKFSTKTEEHERRSQTPSSDITITENGGLHVQPKVFFKIHKINNS